MTESIVFITHESKIIQGDIAARDKDRKLNLCKFPIDKETYLVYSGEILNGYTHGEGSLVYEYDCGDGDVEFENEFMGHFKNGERDGYGISYHPNTWYPLPEDSNVQYHRKEYEGDWKHNQRHGKGIEYWYYEEKIYEGDWKDDQRHGNGIEYYENGQKEYEGNWKDGQRHGKGISYYENGQKEYEGNWKNGYEYGKGIFYTINGSIDFKGRYIQGKWFDETTSFLQKYLETRDSSILKKVTAKEIQGYLEKNFNQTYSSQKRKPFLIQELEKLYQKKKEEIIIEEIDYDEFGNEITTQCLGSDGNIYDISSMYYLFERNEDGDYKNIPYKYEKNERVPNFPRMGNGQILKDFEILLN